MPSPRELLLPETKPSTHTRSPVPPLCLGDTQKRSAFYAETRGLGDQWAVGYVGCLGIKKKTHTGQNGLPGSNANNWRHGFSTARAAEATIFLGPLSLEPPLAGARAGGVPTRGPATKKAYTGRWGPPSVPILVDCVCDAAINILVTGLLAPLREGRECRSQSPTGTRNPGGFLRRWLPSGDCLEPDPKMACRPPRPPL